MFWPSRAKLWKRENGRANQNPKVSKMFAWVLVELITIHAIGVSVKIANSTQTRVRTVVVPRLRPYISIGMTSLPGSSGLDRRRRRQRPDFGAACVVSARPTEVLVLTRAHLPVGGRPAR